VEDTWNPIRNSGIMQAHDGASWKSWGNPETYKQQRDCIFRKSSEISSLFFSSLSSIIARPEALLNTLL
jgi:hypothetical protein